jgi:hypothetical protein
MGSLAFRSRYIAHPVAALLCFDVGNNSPAAALDDWAHVAAAVLDDWAHVAAAALGSMPRFANESVLAFH